MMEVVRGRFSLGVVAFAVACSAGSTGNQTSGPVTVGDGDATDTAAVTSSTDDAAATATDGPTADGGLTSTSGPPVGSDSSGAPPMATTTGAEPGSADYLLSIDDQGVVARLLAIDTRTGIGEELCLLAPDLNYNSLTFSRDGVLFAHSVVDMAIDRVDPCTCETIRIAEGLVGNTQLTADEANGLYGLDLTTDVFVAINPATGGVTTIGSLGLDFTNCGVAWSDDIGTAYALEGVGDALYRIDLATGDAINPVPLAMDFGTVGLEYHHPHGILYACSSDATLLTIDPVSGGVQTIGAIGGASCDNLAAPWEPIACLEGT